MPKSSKSSKPFSKLSTFKLRPSESHRWTHCTASPFFIQLHEDEIDDSDSVFAAEGTLAHDHGGNSLLMGWSAQDFDDPEMAQYVKGYVDFCLKQLEKGDLLWVEETIPLFYNPKSESGTADCAIIQVKDDRVVKLRINDLKYGMGVSVQAKKNTQLAIYGMSVARKVEQKTGAKMTPETLVTLAIYQPRVIGEKAVRLWAMTFQELENFCEGIRKKHDQIRAAKSWDDVEFVPGEHICRFCDIKHRCPDYGAYLLEEVPEVSEALESAEENPVITLPDPKGLSEKQISILVNAKPELIKWLKALEDFAEMRIKQGHHIPGLKVVQGQLGNRQYSDEKKAEKFLTPLIPKKDRVLTTLISPAQAEKYVKARLDKENFDEFMEKFNEQIVRKQGGLKLVTEDDPRQPAIKSLSEEFAFVTEDDQHLLD